MMPYRILQGSFELLDQRRLPHQVVFHRMESGRDIYSAIETMVVRGAPCIGVAARWGMLLALKKNGDHHLNLTFLNQTATWLKQARPTAVNLAFEIDRVVNLLLPIEPSRWVVVLEDYISQQERLETEKLDQLTSFGAIYLQRLFELKQKKLTLMTHCNTGRLACGPEGTALGVIEKAYSQGLVEKVFVDETRPYLQGTRLTSFELTQAKIPHQIVVEGAASYILGNHGVDAILVGADRIVSNGDTANKVGTSGLAIIAQYYQVPFVVVAPRSSYDFSLSQGGNIPIEMREETEILKQGELWLSHPEARALNPSFDVTAAEHITAHISEYGIFHAPFVNSLATMGNK